MKVEFSIHYGIIPLVVQIVTKWLQMKPLSGSSH